MNQPVPTPKPTVLYDPQLLQPTYTIEGMILLFGWGSYVIKAVFGVGILGCMAPKGPETAGGYLYFAGAMTVLAALLAGGRFFRARAFKLHGVETAGVVTALNRVLKHNSAFAIAADIKEGKEYTVVATFTVDGKVYTARHNTRSPPEVGAGVTILYVRGRPRWANIVRWPVKPAEKKQK